MLHGPSMDWIQERKDAIDQTAKESGINIRNSRVLVSGRELGMKPPCPVPSVHRGWFEKNDPDSSYWLEYLLNKDLELSSNQQVDVLFDHQTVFYAKEFEFSDSFVELGPPLDTGTVNEDGSFNGPLYTFTLATWDLAGKPNANYRATATADLDSSDDTLDIIIIENRVTVYD